MDSIIDSLASLAIALATLLAAVGALWKVIAAEKKIDRTDKKLDNGLRTVDTIHTLVDSERRLALKTAVTLAERLAGMSGASAEDKEAFAKARQALDEHDSRQAQADRLKDAHKPKG